MPKRVSIIGFGQVGQSLAFLLGHSAEPIRLNLIDPWPNLGAYEDILHSYQVKGSDIALNDMESLPKSDVIFHCAGPTVPEGSTRLSVTQKSLELTEEIFAPIQFGSKSPLIIVLANPVDLVSLQIQRTSQLDPSRIIGTGTLLDTRRFNSLMDRELAAEPGTSQAFVLGEHGDSMSLWSGGSLLGGELMADSVSPELLQSVLQKTREMAAYIKRFQGATYYGVSRCAVRIWETFYGEEVEILPVSVCVPPEYRSAWNGDPFWMSLPCHVGRGLAVPVRLEPLDQAPLEGSAQRLKQAWPSVQPDLPS